MKKFLFDTHDFDDSKVDDTPPAPTFSEEQLELARQQSLAQGKAEGVRETRSAQEEKISALLQAITAQCGLLVAAEEKREMEKCIDAAKMALKITHKLLPQFAQRYALSEIENVIVKSIDARRDEPRIAVTVSTHHLEALRARVDVIAAEKGYSGKLILIADDNLSAADCRVEWADGGAERLYERIYAQIETEFANAIAGMKSTMDGGNNDENR